MNIRKFDIPDVKLVVPKRLTDVRGYFSETWSDRVFRQEIALEGKSFRQMVPFE